jgi:hypothetical protein
MDSNADFTELIATEEISLLTKSYQTPEKYYVTQLKYISRLTTRYTYKLPCTREAFTRTLGDPES